MTCVSRADQTCTSLGHCPLTPICTVEIAVGRLNPIGVLRKTDERRLRIALDDHRQWRRRHRTSVFCVRVKGWQKVRELDVFIVSAWKTVFVVSVRNINIFVRILTQFTGLLRTNTLAAKRDLLAERTCLAKSVSVSLRKNFYYIFTGESTSKADEFDNLRSMKIFITNKRLDLKRKSVVIRDVIRIPFSLHFVVHPFVFVPWYNKNLIN